MKNRFLWVVVLAVAALGSMTCQQVAGLSDQDKAAIHKVADDAIRIAIGPNADWGAYVNLYYAEGAKVLMPGMPVLEGREAIKAAFAAMGTIQDMKFNSLSLEGRGDLACERGTYSETFIPPGMSAPIADTGKGITIWRKQADGTWKATDDIWNSDVPPAGLVLPTGAAKPDAGPELKRLGWLVGTWKLEGESKGSPFLPAGKFAAAFDGQWFNGGSQLLCLYNISFPNGPAQELSVYGYDSEAKSYWNFDMDSTGMSSFGKVVIQDSGWTHVWDYKIGGKLVKIRLVLYDMTPNGCAMKNDYSLAGGPWIPLAEAKATRVK